MGSIILAAGRGERLAGIAAPYMKPALLVNGVPLIVQQVRNALERSDSMTLVLAPENARPMIDLVEQGVPELKWNSVNVVVQPRPRGVVDALKRGLMLHDGVTVVLMGDNVVPPLTVRQMMDDFIGQQSADLMVATRQMPWNDAERFTYRSAGCWFEKEVAPVVDATEDHAEAWVGPLFIKATDEMYAALGSGDSIGRTFNAFSHVITWPGQCSDIGVPEALQ